MLERVLLVSEPKFYDTLPRCFSYSLSPFFFYWDNVAASPFTEHASSLAERACSTITGVTHTFYGYPDNDPPGPATAYNCGGRNNIAGGTGTYTDPLTFASAPGEFSTCEVIYVPYLKKYARFEDSCAQCSTCVLFSVVQLLWLWGKGGGKG
ncbi:MAG: hypothetical protein Q9222_004348 [Ikaeria aurantiellina]